MGLLDFFKPLLAPATKALDERVEALVKKEAEQHLSATDAAKIEATADAVIEKASAAVDKDVEAKL